MFAGDLWLSTVFSKHIDFVIDSFLQLGKPYWPTDCSVIFQKVSHKLDTLYEGSCCSILQKGKHTNTDLDLPLLHLGINSSTMAIDNKRDDIGSTNKKRFLQQLLQCFPCYV